MNDIYEQKARKYKYKYLKLKRLKKELEYTAEGGMFGNVYNNLLNLFSSKTDANKSQEIVYGEHHKQAASENQKNFRNKLVSLQKEIIEKIVPLYGNEIIGNINNINFTMNEKINLKYTVLPMEKNIVSNTLKNNIEKIVKNPVYADYYPPIIKCFYNIDNNQNIKKSELFRLLGLCFTSIAAKSKNEVILEKDNKKIDTSYQILLKELLKILDKNSDFNYNMYYIYELCIQPFIKDVDYYALTKVICNLYDEYNVNNKDNKITENKTENNNSLDELFSIFKLNFLNNAINKENFLTQLNNIIKAIKE
jgi:hypothetical protein